MKTAPTLETVEAAIIQCKGIDFSEDMQRLWQQITEDAQSQAETQKIDENTILYQIDARFLNPEKELPHIKTYYCPVNNTYPSPTS